MTPQAGRTNLAIFFGCSIAFAAIRRLTEDAGRGVTLLAQLGAAAVVVTVIVLVVRRRGDGEADRRRDDN